MTPSLPNSSVLIQIGNFFYASTLNEEKNTYHFKCINPNRKDTNAILHPDIAHFPSLNELISYTTTFFKQECKFVTEKDFLDAFPPIKEIPNAIYLQCNSSYYISNCKDDKYIFAQLTKNGTPHKAYGHSGYHNSLSDALKCALTIKSTKIIAFKDIPPYFFHHTSFNE